MTQAAEPDGPNYETPELKEIATLTKELKAARAETKKWQDEAQKLQALLREMAITVRGQARVMHG